MGRYVRKLFFGGNNMNKHHEYEAMKQAWITDNPDATPQQYEMAVRAIAEMAGI